MKSELPDLFRCENGERVQVPADWLRRRQELLKLVLDIEYGQLPSSAGGTEARLLHQTGCGRLLKARHRQYRILAGPGGRCAFLLDLLIPDGTGPFPVALTGDACWHTISDDIALAVLGRRYIIARFNRVEIVPDSGKPDQDRVSGLYRIIPGDYGAVAAWAWGYHRCVDVLLGMAEVAGDQIAIVGASRGGKTTLLAGAVDERIALTVANGSGCCGAGCFRRQGEGSETLEMLLKDVAYWMSPRLGEFIGRVKELPFDQHAVKALVAPRALLTTEALGDLYANPTGTWLTHAAAREVYRFLGVPDRIGISYREGEHAHILADWVAFLDFADWQFRGIRPARRFDECPFQDLAPAHSWSM